MPVPTVSIGSDIIWTDQQISNPMLQCNILCKMQPRKSSTCIVM